MERNFDPTNPREFVEALDPAELSILGKTIMDVWKEKGGKLAALTRCPVCERPMKNWHTYKPTWSQVKICFSIIEILKQGHKHVHIKTTLNLVPIKHRDHTVSGVVMSHYSKMMYMNMVARCNKNGEILGHFVPPSERDDRGLGQFTITKEGYDFIHGKAALCPGKVRIKDEKIIDVPELRNTKVWVHELFEEAENGTEMQDEWMDSKGQFTLFFPEEFLPPPDTISLDD